MVLIRHRETARIALRADSGRFLLMLTHWSPESGLEPRWVTPGGGIEPNEHQSVAAARELLEETGLLVVPAALGAKIAEIDFRQNWRSGDFETGKAHIFGLRVRDEFEICRSMWTADERRDIVEVRWWSPAELIDSGVPVGPPGLATLLVELGERL